MNHDHESIGGSNQVEAPYFIHENDVAALKHKISVQKQFSNRVMLDKDLEVIPALGHTPGTTLFLGMMVITVTYLLEILYVLKGRDGVQLY